MVDSGPKTSPFVYRLFFPITGDDLLQIPSESRKVVRISSFRKKQKPNSFELGFCFMGDGGFGPPKSVTTDLQSAPFGRSGNLP